MLNRGDERSVRAAYGVLGRASLVVLLGLLTLLVLGACSGQPTGSPEQDHPHTPGAPPHTHAPPGSVGEALEKKLEEPATACPH